MAGIADLWVDYKNFAFRNSNFSVTEFIGVPIPEPCIKWVIILWEECFDVLKSKNSIRRTTNRRYQMVGVRIKKCQLEVHTSKQAILNS